MKFPMRHRRDVVPAYTPLQYKSLSNLNSRCNTSSFGSALRDITTLKVPFSASHFSSSSSQYDTAYLSKLIVALTLPPLGTHSLAKPFNSLHGRRVAHSISETYNCTISCPSLSPVFITSTDTLKVRSPLSPKSTTSGSWRFEYSKVVYERPNPK